MKYLLAAAEYLLAQEEPSLPSGVPDIPAWSRALWDAGRAHLRAMVDQRLEHASGSLTRQQHPQYRGDLESGGPKAVHRWLVRNGARDLLFAQEIAHVVRWIQDIEVVMAGRMNSEGMYVLLETTRGILSKDHADTCCLAHHLGCAYQDEGRLARAIDIYQDTLARRQRVLGERHSDTLITANNLACAYRGAGQVARAIVMLRRITEQCTQQFGPEHPQTLVGANNLARAYEMDGDQDGAAQTYQTALVHAQRTLGDHHPLTLALSDGLAQVRRAIPSRISYRVPQEQTSLPGAAGALPRQWS
jgi:tetratricopeptide (TPR) repeat protein